MQKQADIPVKKAVNGQEVLTSWGHQTAFQFQDNTTRLTTEKVLEKVITEFYSFLQVRKNGFQ